MYKETTPFELVKYFKLTLQKFISHNYIARWQDSQCKLAMEGLREGQILSHIDFSENYKFQTQDEVQSQYYHTVSVTILVHITYRLVVNQARNTSKIVKESHFYISDDKKHDSFFVQHCMLQHWTWLKELGVSPTEHVVFSDGSSAQFKGCNSMFFVGRWLGLTSGCSMRWEYFGTTHGKGKFLLN
jgi:hypothetical protein